MVSLLTTLGSVVPILTLTIFLSSATIFCCFPLFGSTFSSSGLTLEECIRGAVGGGVGDSVGVGGVTRTKLSRESAVLGGSLSSTRFMALKGAFLPLSPPFSVDLVTSRLVGETSFETTGRDGPWRFAAAGGFKLGSATPAGGGNLGPEAPAGGILGSTAPAGSKPGAITPPAVDTAGVR